MSEDIEGKKKKKKNAYIQKGERYAKFFVFYYFIPQSDILNLQWVNLMGYVRWQHITFMNLMKYAIL